MRKSAVVVKKNLMNAIVTGVHYLRKRGVKVSFKRVFRVFFFSFIVFHETD